MKKFLRSSFFLCLISGIFFGLSLPPLNFHVLIFFAFAILIYLLSKTEKFSRAFLKSYLIFFVFGLVSISWISLSGMLENADRFLIFGGIIVLIVNPLFFAIPSLIFFYLKKLLSDTKYFLLPLIAFPFIWTSFEYLFTLSQVSFPWLLLGNSQTYNLNKLQYIEITGVFGVSFWICIIGVLLFITYDKFFRNGWKNYKTQLSFSVLIILFVYFLPDIYSVITSKKVKYTEAPSGEKIKVGIVQPNINPWKKWGSKQDELIHSYVEQIEELYKSDSLLSLIVLPETALPYYFREAYFADKFKLVEDANEKTNVPILIGAPDLLIYKDSINVPVDAKQYKSSGEKYDTFNSAVLITKDKNVSEYQTYHKIKLVAGSERMPYQEKLPFIQDLIQWGVGISSWQIGMDTVIFKTNDFKFNTAICYESVYPEFFSGFVSKGAEFSVIITNDGWWGKLFGTYQHNQYAVLRAIENRRWIVRSANTGISCFIDPFGNMYDATQINEKKNIIHEIELRKEKTFYTENGDLFSRICLIIGGIFFVSAFLLKKKQFV